MDWVQGRRAGQSQMRIVAFGTSGGEILPVGGEYYLHRPALRMAGQGLGDPAEILVW